MKKPKGVMLPTEFFNIFATVTAAKSKKRTADDASAAESQDLSKKIKLTIFYNTRQED
jgi:hypothetical protein